MNSVKRLYQSNATGLIATFLILSIYLTYVVFLIRGNQGPIDYETFMQIGNRFIEGEAIYTENSYYPLPYVAVFGLLSLLPRYLSMALWLLGPVFIALAITRFRPYALLFAPVLSHFTGGQSSVFGLLGFFGYRMNLDPSKYVGGFFLALTFLKPQLGLVPAMYAVYRWARFARENRRIPRQAISFLAVLGLMYLPAFVLRPEWLVEWLSVPRPLFYRAISSAIPRILFWISSPGGITYWLLWFVLSAAVIAVVWRLRGDSHALDVLLLTSLIVNPLIHDYDLIQVLPTIWGPIMPAASIILSIPGWWTIVAQYGNDAAWITFTMIAPGLLAIYIYQSRKVHEDETDSIATRFSGVGMKIGSLLGLGTKNERKGVESGCRAR